MKKVNFRKIIVAAAVLCLCVSVGAAAAGRSGRFRDIIGWNGAVTGSVYEQAAGELAVEAAAGEKELAVTVRLLVPDALPYSSLETIGLDRWQIVDLAGNVLAEGEGTSGAKIRGGEAELRLPIEDLPTGEYRLMLGAFRGEKKADQPLKIVGLWACPFVR